MNFKDPNEDGRALRNSRYPRSTFDKPNRFAETVIGIIFVALVTTCIGGLSHIKHLRDEIATYQNQYYYECGARDDAKRKYRS